MKTMIPFKAQITCLAVAMSFVSFAQAQAQITHQTAPAYGTPSYQIQLADLLPFTFTPVHEETDEKFRTYRFSLVIANAGARDAHQVPVLIGMRVLASKDAVNYPVGYKNYVGWGLMDEPCAAYQFTTLEHGRFNIPKAVTKCEIYVIVDRLMQGIHDHWDNDSAEDYRGRIAEKNEDNNVSAPYLFSFPAIQAERYPELVPMR